jgi:hypothetical protein
LSFIELRTKRDTGIFQEIYARSVRIGQDELLWEISYGTEFHMTNDSKLFPLREKWEANGFVPDVFGRWVKDGGNVALPLYQGRMIHHFDFWRSAYISGHGPSSVWQPLPFDNKEFKPRHLMALEIHQEHGIMPSRCRVVFRDIARNTDTRSLIACCIPPFPCNNKLPILSTSARIEHSLLLASVLSSICFDFVLRQRHCGATINWFILEECPLPALSENDDVRASSNRVVIAAAGLTFLHRRFAPEWLRLRHLYPELAAKQWKHWWAVTEDDRLRLRVEIDALCADLYGLAPDDFDWIVRDDPNDPKGFYRVDRQLPFRERLTGLAAAAFRALKEGKWSAESTAKLSNDRFFEIIGIPEMTTGPEPLVRKRDGCHRWKPEEFGKDDPRHGWTWDHCWQDAVALLGSEEAVREYVEGKQEQATEKPGEGESGEDGPTDLFGQPLPPKQRKLF